MKYRYCLIDMWENLPFPEFIHEPGDPDQLMTFNDLDEAKAACIENCQDGYILDFQSHLIIKL